MAVAVITAMAISSCDEDTLTIGNSLTSESDELSLTTKTESVFTNTVRVDSVLSTAATCYLGQIEDPETHTEIRSDFSTQFYLLPSLYISDEQYILSKEDGEVIADSCDIVLYPSTPYNSSAQLNAMTIRVREMQTTIDPSIRYYSNYDNSSLLRTSKGGIDYSHVFTYSNLTDSEESRQASTYLENIRIPLNQPYTDSDNKQYKNYGTYILRKLLAYRKEHNSFPNAYVFAHEICPGVSFQITNGAGFHAAIPHVGLRVYYQVNRDSIYTAAVTMAGTKEVMQTIRIINDKKSLDSLANLTTHTYLKTPAGLFTEALMPIESVWKDHENDSLLAAKISFQRMNNLDSNSDALTTPPNVLMVMKDSLYNFFESKKLPDSKTWFVSAFSSSYNTYTFTNISSLLTRMWNLRKNNIEKDPTWADPKSDHYKVVLVPVTYTTTSSSSSPTSIMHDLSLRSTKLVGGPDSPIELNVVFAKFNQ